MCSYSLVATLKEKLTKVKFTNLEKILLPKLGITKVQIIEYSIKIAPKMLVFLANRLLVLRRFPDGIEQTGFHGKDVLQEIPSSVKAIKGVLMELWAKEK